MALTAVTRRCASCRAILPDPPAPPVCGSCGAVAIAVHTDWDPRVKFFLAAAFLSHHVLSAGRGEQSAWELALETLIAGAGGSRPSPFGMRFEAPAVECYPTAYALAVHWRKIGAPVVPQLIDTIGRGAGLIAPSHPTRRAS